LRGFSETPVHAFQAIGDLTESFPSLSAEGGVMLGVRRTRRPNSYWTMLAVTALGLSFSSAVAFADDLDGALGGDDLSVQSTDLSAFQTFEAGVLDVEKAVQPNQRLRGSRIALWTNPGTGPTGDLHETVLKELLQRDFDVIDLERSGQVSAAVSDTAGNRTVAVAGSAPAVLLFAPIIEMDYLLTLRIAEVLEETWKPLVPPELESDWTATQRAETAARDVYIVRLEAELIRASGPDLCALWTIETTAETVDTAAQLAAQALIEEVAR